MPRSRTHYVGDKCVPAHPPFKSARGTDEAATGDGPAGEAESPKRADNPPAETGCAACAGKVPHNECPACSKAEEHWLPRPLPVEHSVCDDHHHAYEAELRAKNARKYTCIGEIPGGERCRLPVIIDTMRKVEAERDAANARVLELAGALRELTDDNDLYPSEVKTCKEAAAALDRVEALAAELHEHGTIQGQPWSDSHMGWIPSLYMEKRIREAVGEGKA